MAKSSIAKAAKISKSIQRVINIGNYQSIRVSVHIEENIQYIDDDDFDTKSNQLSIKVSNDLVSTINIANKELKIDSFEKKIFGNSKPSVPTKVEVDDELFDSLTTTATKKSK